MVDSNAEDRFVLTGADVLAVDAECDDTHLRRGIRRSWITGHATLLQVAQFG